MSLPRIPEEYFGPDRPRLSQLAVGKSSFVYFMYTHVDADGHLYAQRDAPLDGTQPSTQYWLHVRREADGLVLILKRGAELTHWLRAHPLEKIPEGYEPFVRIEEED